MASRFYGALAVPVAAPSTDWAFGAQDFLTTIQAYNCTITRIQGGLYQVDFPSAHPNGANYTVTTGGEEAFNTRDNPKVTVVRGTKTPTSVRLMVTVDDNGGTADTLVDDAFSFVIKRTA